MKRNMAAFLAAVVAVWFGEIMQAGAQAQDNMVLIPSGTFVMGTPSDEPGRVNEDGVQHTVTITKPFYLSATEVTKIQWDTVRIWGIANGYSDLPIGRNGASGREGWEGDKDKNYPVTQISWQDVVKWCNAKSQMEGRTPMYRARGAIYKAGLVYRNGLADYDNVVCDWNANGYRLPTEAEWEYACRAGTTTAFYTGPIVMTGLGAVCVADTNISMAGWYCANGDGHTHPVGQKQPNGWGLYDMHGNVSEWCWDWYVYGEPDVSVAIDPVGFEKPNQLLVRVIRGGGWNSNPWSCRSASRVPYKPDWRDDGVGFRLALLFAPRWKQVIETQTVQPTYGEPPKKEDGKDSLVVVTHGWIPKESGQKSPPDLVWVDEMVTAISNNVVVLRGLKNWQVGGYKWKEGAWLGYREALTGSLLSNADREGINLGNRLKQQGWKHIHFIAHSAGVAVIQTASLLIKENDASTVIHTTFLDAYVGFTYNGRSKYGLASDWSDSYFAKDPETFDSLFSRTEGRLDYAYGVDVTWIEPNKKTISVHRSSNGITGTAPCLYTVTTHEWPHMFYLKTVPPETVIGAERFGFPLSKEGGGWEFATNTYPVEVKSAYIKVLGRPDSDCPAFGESSVPVYSGPKVDLTQVQTITSTTGIIKTTGTGLILTSGGRLQQQSLQGMRKNTAPASESAWLAASVAFTNIVNFISFDAQFLSAKTEGLLTAYWQTNTLGSIDERAVFPGLQQYTYALPATLTNSSYTLGFRLDSFSNAASSIVITNMVFGFIGIREPFGLTVNGVTADGTRIFSLTGPSGYNYRVELSTNLTEWSTVALLVNTNGTVNFSDPSSTNANRRFYRAATP